MRETPHVAANSSRTSVALLIVCGNRTTGSGQLRADVLVTTAVLRETVNEDDDALRAFRGPRPAKQQMTGRPGKMGFRSTDSGLFRPGCVLRETGWTRQRGQDSDALRIAARASLTR